MGIEPVAGGGRFNIPQQNNDTASIDQKIEQLKAQLKQVKTNKSLSDAEREKRMENIQKQIQRLEQQKAQKQQAAAQKEQQQVPEASDNGVNHFDQFA